MNILDILIQARARISNPESWVQGFNAVGVNRFRTEINDSNAVSWCAVGAIGTVSVDYLPISFSDYSPPHHRAINALEKQLKADGFTDTLTSFNDTHTHQEVLGLFDTTIANLKRKSK